MNDFDERWQHAVDRARAAAPKDATMPAGFAAALGQRQAGLAPEPRLEQVWLTLTVRSLIGVAAALFLSLALDRYWAATAPVSFVPYVEPREVVGFWSP